jgi:hypothetical protein
VKSVRRLGKAWFKTLNFSRGKVSQQGDKSASLRQLQTVVNDKDKRVEATDMRILRRIKAVPDIDRAFRESVNFMRHQGSEEPARTHPRRSGGPRG